MNKQEGMKLSKVIQNQGSEAFEGWLEGRDLHVPEGEGLVTDNLDEEKGEE